METKTEIYCRKYFENKGYFVIRRIPNSKNQIKNNMFFNIKKGECNYIIKKGKELIYLEVKTSSTVLFSKEQLNFIKEKIDNNERVFIAIIDKIGSIIVLEFLKELKIKFLEKGFINFKENELFFFLNNRGSITFDFINPKNKLIKHLNKLKSLRNKK